MTWNGLCWRFSLLEAQSGLRTYRMIGGAFLGSPLCALDGSGCGYRHLMGLGLVGENGRGRVWLLLD